mgnify:CR=1 FL=1
MSRLRLREVRLSGFKTFADKTTIAFTPGITAIVGPNGSGKSNVVDALRWALGEAGRGIRSKRVDEVIFAGSEKRRPLGLAEVSLSIANEDGLFDLPFTEIEIAAKAAELVYPSKSAWKGELVLVFQKIESLHKACPKSRGDWYFTGDYPTPGGNKVVNTSFINYIEGKDGRAY